MSLQDYHRRVGFAAPPGAGDIWQETPRMSWADWDVARKQLGIRNLETHPIRKVKTAGERFKAFCAELDAANSAMSADDAALLARLEALPRPAWMRALANYETHTARMRAWFKELDRTAAPLTWRAISVERVAQLEAQTVGGNVVQGMPFTGKVASRLIWSEKRRIEVQRIAAARGDIFAPGMQGPELTE